MTLLTLLALGARPAAAWELLGPGGVGTGREVPAEALFQPERPGWEDATVRTDPAALADAARTALAWFDAHPTDAGTRPGAMAELGVDRGRIRRTLVRLVQITEEDAAAHRDSRLRDPTFLAANFDIFRWHPDREAGPARRHALGETQLRLTHYFVPQVEGSATRDATYSAALYADPGPSWDTLTRQDVFGGAFEPGGVAAGASRALVWLRPEHAQDALLQGTVAVRVGDTTTLYNVDRPNKYPYRSGVAQAQQERLWYFKEVAGLFGWGASGDKIRLTEGVSVAGDPYNLGIGKLVVLEHADGRGGTALRVVIVGDTGGAFQPNLFQLDFLAGVFPDRTALGAAMRGLPDRVSAAILLVREPPVEPPPVLY